MKFGISLLILGIACSAFGNNARAQEIALENAGFESDLQSWSAVPQQFKDQASIVTGTAHTGGKSLRIDATAKQNNPFVLRQVDKLEGGATYRLSAWARAEAGQAAQRAAIKLEYYNAEGKNTSGYYGFVALPATGEWKQFEVSAPADFDTTSVRLYVRAYSSGAMLFDDLKFEKTSSAPDIVALQSRMVAESGAPVNANFEIWLREPWTQAAPPAITFEARGPNGIITVPASAQAIEGQPANLQRFRVSAQLPPLQQGDYSIHIKHGERTTRDPARVFITLKNRQPKNLTDDGTLLWKGKPFFQIGMYHPYQRENDYKLLSENGFNAVQGNGTHDFDAFKEDLDRAQRYGLAYDVPLYADGKVKANLPNSLEKIRRFKDHPAILCWKIIDEPDIQSNGGVADEVPEVYRALKAADNVHPIELTLAHDASLAYWANFCDIVQIDRYPVPSRPLTDVLDFSRNAVAAKKPWQNLTYVLQSGWVPDLSNQPSVAQARSMVYLSLIAGAKGIFWYSMREPNWDLTKTPFWPEMKAINAEITLLSTPIMLGQNVSGIQSDNAKVHFTARRHKGKLYLLLTNPENAPAHVTFTLPGNLQASNARHLNGHRDGGNIPVALAGNAFSLDLAATDSRTIVLDVK